MLLICDAHCANECVGPDFAAIVVTPAFRRTLRRRARLVQDLFLRAQGVSLRSVLFQDLSPVWFTWFEARDEILDRVLKEDALIVPGFDSVLPQQDAAGAGFIDRRYIGTEALLTRTEADAMEVWPDRFRFSCCIRDRGFRICSADICFAQFPQLAPDREHRPEERNSGKETCS